MSEQVLIAEDDVAMRELLAEVLGDRGFRVLTAADGQAALLLVRQLSEPIDLVITDVRMPGLKGDELLAAVRTQRAAAPVIVITAFGSVEQAVELVKAGAFQYITKPFATHELLSAVEQALQLTAPQREQARLRRQLPATPTDIIGASRQMHELFDLIGRAAHSASTVLITGESGTGKELVARAIHQMSQRTGQFVPINCAAIPAELIESELFGHTAQAFTGARQARQGLFEMADGGTIFLDEVAELPLLVQPKLLRALQEGKIRRVGANVESAVNARVVVATNRALEEETQRGRFRSDLYWRLNVIPIHVPALRERPFDIPLLVEHFIHRVAKSLGRPPLDVQPETLAILTAYSWPGNIRELENAIERAVALARGARLTPEDLPERVRNWGETAAFIAAASERHLSLREIERAYILEIMRRVHGNKSRAAEVLGLDRKTLYRRLDEYEADSRKGEW